MGILNLTPDSFSDGGKYLSPAAAVERAWRIAEEGADLLDIGAESTRPGALSVPPEEEWRRLEPVLSLLAKGFPIPVSVDTRRASVARRALELGAEVVNDVSGGRDPEMIPLVAAARCGYVLMHSRGEPSNMSEFARYQAVVEEVREELARSQIQALQGGLAAECLALDPGFGFAKNPEHNWTLLEGLEQITSLGAPLLVGLSRKRMLRERVGTDPEALLAAGLRAAETAIRKGARILRVHEVAPTRSYLQALQNE